MNPADCGTKMVKAERLKQSLEVKDLSSFFCQTLGIFDDFFEKFYS